MNDQRLDTLSRALAEPMPRRRALRVLATGALALLGTHRAGGAADARVCRGSGEACDPSGRVACCDGGCCGGDCCAAGERCADGFCVPAVTKPVTCSAPCDPWQCQTCGPEGVCVSTCRANEVCAGGDCAPVCPPCEQFDPTSQQCLWTCNRGEACIDGTCAACCSGSGYCDRGPDSGIVFTAEGLCCVYPDESLVFCYPESSPGAGDGGGWAGCCGGTVPCPEIPLKAGWATGGVPDPSPGDLACPYGHRA